MRNTTDCSSQESCFKHKKFHNFYKSFWIIGTNNLNIVVVLCKSFMSKLHFFFFLKFLEIWMQEKNSYIFQHPSGVKINIPFPFSMDPKHIGHQQSHGTKKSLSTCPRPHFRMRTKELEEQNKSFFSVCACCCCCRFVSCRACFHFVTP